MLSVESLSCKLHQSMCMICVCVKSALLSLGELPMVSQVVVQHGQALIDTLLRVSLAIQCHSITCCC